MGPRGGVPLLLLRLIRALSEDPRSNLTCVPDVATPRLRMPFDRATRRWLPGPSSAASLAAADRAIPTPSYTISDASSVSSCLVAEGRSEAAQSPPAQFRLSCLAASARALHMPYSVVFRCLEPCVRHWTGSWGVDKPLWEELLARGRLARHGPPHPLLLQHNNEILLARGGALVPASRRNGSGVQWSGGETRWMAFTAPLNDYAAVLDEARRQAVRVSLLEFHDLYRPRPEQEPLLSHPALKRLFVQNPSPSFVNHSKALVPPHVGGWGPCPNLPLLRAVPSPRGTRGQRME